MTKHPWVVKCIKRESWTGFPSRGMSLTTQHFRIHLLHNRWNLLHGHKVLKSKRENMFLLAAKRVLSRHSHGARAFSDNFFRHPSKLYNPSTIDIICKGPKETINSWADHFFRSMTRLGVFPVVLIHSNPSLTVWWYSFILSCWRRPCEIKFPVQDNNTVSSVKAQFRTSSPEEKRASVTPPHLAPTWGRQICTRNFWRWKSISFTF